MVTTGSLWLADTTSSPLLLLLCSFFLSVLDPSSLSLLPVAFSFSLLCFLEKKQRNEILFFSSSSLPGSVVPPLFLYPVFSVQDKENGDRTRCCWLMDQNFPWFCLSSSSPVLSFFLPPCDSSPSPCRSLIFSGFIAREYQPFETASKPLLLETAPEEEGDEQLLKTVPFVRWK